MTDPENTPVRLNSKGKPSKGTGRQNAPYTNHAGTKGLGGSRYTYEEKVKGLTAVVIAGSCKKAARWLKETSGWKIAPKTLEYWVETSDRDLYIEIAETEAPRIRKNVAADQEKLAREATEVELELLRSLKSDLDNGNLDARDKSTALRNASVTKSIAVDKGNILRDRPTDIVEHVNILELRSKWEKHGIDFVKLAGGDVVDSTATEETSLLEEGS